ncbi:NADH-quinone oxidoreductase subunit H, partial [bacterium]
MSWLQSLSPMLQDILAAFGRAVLFVLPIFMAVPFLIWFERRLLSWFQDRIGPNRTGNITFSRTSRYVPNFLRGRKWKFFGLAQSMADGIKLFTKEDILPKHTDLVLFLVAPAISLFVALSLGGTIPWGPFPKLTPVSDANIGLLYILAISSLGAYGSVLAGYSSNNKYSLMGGLRAGAQLISYELAMGVSLGGMVMATGSLKMTEIVHAQEGPLWGAIPFLQNWNLFTPFGALSGAIFFICMLAETNRPPFDLPEAENELVAGYHTEYSTKRWGLFMMAEYIAMLVFSLIFWTVFGGGYNLLPVRWDWLAANTGSLGSIFGGIATFFAWISPLTMLVKGAIGIFVYIWIRGTYPRLRYDQLMNLGWKTLLPLATANLMTIATWIVVTRVYGTAAGWATALLIF